MDQILQIPLEQIQPSRGNRAIGGYDQAKLEELAVSIAAIGVQQPAVVRKVGDVYELVAGERRWRASKLAGVATLPCVVRELDDETALRIQIIENLQREDVHPLDEAEGYARLQTIGKCEAEYIATQVGRSVAYVYQRMQLKKLCKEARKDLIDGRISVGHANLLARLPSAQQIQALKLAYFNDGEDSRTVKQLDELIRRDILMEIGRAAFSKSDEKLFPKAGSCKGCTKRSGAAPLLFADVGKKDHCLDPECFAEKQRRDVEAKRRELKGTPHLEVFDDWASTSIPGVLKRYDWNECKANEPMAQRVLIVGGNDIGRLTWGKPTWQASVKSPQQKILEAQERKATRDLMSAKEEVRLQIYKGISAASADKISVDLMEIILNSFWDSLSHDARVQIAKVEGWEVAKSEYHNGPDMDKTFENMLESVGNFKSERQKQTHLLVALAFAGFTRGGPYTRTIPEYLSLAAAESHPTIIDQAVESAAEKYGISKEILLGEKNDEEFNEYADESENEEGEE